MKDKKNSPHPSKKLMPKCQKIAQKHKKVISLLLKYDFTSNRRLKVREIAQIIIFFVLKVPPSSQACPTFKTIHEDLEGGVPAKKNENQPVVEPNNSEFASEHVTKELMQKKTESPRKTKRGRPKTQPKTQPIKKTQKKTNRQKVNLEDSSQESNRGFQEEEIEGENKLWKGEIYSNVRKCIVIDKEKQDFAFLNTVQETTLLPHFEHKWENQSGNIILQSFSYLTDNSVMASSFNIKTVYFPENDLVRYVYFPTLEPPTQLQKKDNDNYSCARPTTRSFGTISSPWTTIVVKFFDYFYANFKQKEKILKSMKIYFNNAVYRFQDRILSNKISQVTAQKIQKFKRPGNKENFHGEDLAAKISRPFPNGSPQLEIWKASLKKQLKKRQYISLEND